MVKRTPTKRTIATLPKRVRLRFLELGLPVPPHLERRLKTIEQLRSDLHEWALLYVSPVAATLAFAAAVGVLVVTPAAGSSAEGRGHPFVEAAWLAGFVVVAYGLLRASGAHAAVRVAIPLGLAAMLGVVLAGAALDRSVSSSVRAVAGALAMGVVAILALL